MPRVKTTKTVRAALWALRIYLLILLGLIGLKFVRMFRHPAGAVVAPSSTAPASVPASAHS